jgi:hypothetical protein
LESPKILLCDQEPQEDDDPQKGVVYRDLVTCLRKQAREGVDVVGLLTSSTINLEGLMQTSLGASRSEFSTSIKKAIWGKSGYNKKVVHV